MPHQVFELTLHGFRYVGRVIESERALYDPILFLSGAFQTMSSWDRFIRYFHGKTSLIVVDVPGMGEADLLPEVYGLDFLAESVDAMLSHLGIPRVNVLAASYGSPIAYEFAKAYPQRISHLALAGIMREIPPDQEEPVNHSLACLRRDDLLAFAEVILQGLMCQNPNAEIKSRRAVARLLRSQLLQMTPQHVDRYIANTLRLFLHSPLDITRSPNVPALVFTGEHDTFTKPSYCKEIARSFPNAVFTTIQSADHLCHMEQFDTVVHLIDRFYEDQPLDDTPGCNTLEYFRRDLKRGFGNIPANDP